MARASEALGVPPIHDGASPGRRGSYRCWDLFLPIGRSAAEDDAIDVVCSVTTPTRFTAKRMERFSTSLTKVRSVRGDARIGIGQWIDQTRSKRDERSGGVTGPVRIWVSTEQSRRLALSLAVGRKRSWSAVSPSLATLVASSLRAVTLGSNPCPGCLSLRFKPLPTPSADRAESFRDAPVPLHQPSGQENEPSPYKIRDAEGSSIYTV